MAISYWKQLKYIDGPLGAEQLRLHVREHVNEPIRNFILEHSNENTQLLDGGCSTAINGWDLFEHGYKGSYVGVDESEKHLNWAMKNLEGRPASFAPFALEKMDYPDEHFEIALVKNVIEHNLDYEQILREVSRVTQKCLLLSLSMKLRDEDDLIYRHLKGYYLNHYCREKLYSFAAEIGFVNPDIVFENKTNEVISFEKH